MPDLSRISADEFEQILDALRPRLAEDARSELRVFPPPAGAISGKDSVLIGQLVQALVAEKLTQYATREQTRSIVAEELLPLGIRLDKDHVDEIGNVLRSALKWQRLFNRVQTGFLYALLMASLYYLAAKLGIKLPSSAGGVE